MYLILTRQRQRDSLPIANGVRQTTTCAKCERNSPRGRIVWSDDNLPMPSCTNVRGSPSRLRPGRARASGAPAAHPEPHFSSLARTSAPARSTREEALHYGATAATTGIAGGAHESQPPRSPWPQRLAVMSAARTCCYAAWRHAARKPKRAPWQAAAQSPTRHCFGSRIGGCSRPRRTGLRHGQRIGPGESRCPAGHG